MRPALEGLRSFSATVHGGVLPKAGDSRRPPTRKAHNLSSPATLSEGEGPGVRSDPLSK